MPCFFCDFGSDVVSCCLSGSVCCSVNVRTEEEEELAVVVVFCRLLRLPNVDSSFFTLYVLFFTLCCMSFLFAEVGARVLVLTGRIYREDSVTARTLP